jgi:repressor LexA
MSVTDENVLDFIRFYVSRKGYAPTVREIARGVGLASTSAVWHHLRRLERDGRVSHQAGASRTIRVLAEAS